jgi:deoxycytidylate deaminase
MICHCGVPCAECCKTIINSGIKKVVCQKRDADYSPYSSRWMLEKSGVKLIIVDI